MQIMHNENPSIKLDKECDIELLLSAGGFFVIRLKAILLNGLRQLTIEIRFDVIYRMQRNNLHNVVEMNQRYLSGCP